MNVPQKIGCVKINGTTFFYPEKYVPLGAINGLLWIKIEHDPAQYVPLNGSNSLKMPCQFCKSNGENEGFFTCHALRDRSGKVTCPVLRVYVCPNCQETGDKAHTLKYCPKKPTNFVYRSATNAVGKRIFIKY